MNSPYLKSNNRLADVIAAIQVMAVYKFYKLTFEGWADRIVGDKSKSKYWESIFKEHPEFFRLDQTRTKVSLVWRRSYPKIYNVDTMKLITNADYLKLDPAEQKRISRSPLSNSDIETLINSAINLSTSALEGKKDRDWWKPALAGAIGIILGQLFDLFKN